MDEPLFSKNVDDLLPPAPPPGAKPAAGPPPRRRTESPAPADDPPREPEMKWWQFTLGGGIAVLLIFFVRLVVRNVGNGFDDVDWSEIGEIVPLAFGGGCALGLCFWLFEWLKCRFRR